MAAQADLAKLRPVFRKDELIGYVLVVATTSLNMPLAFAALTILLMMGMVLFSVFDVVERRVAPWAFRGKT